MKTFIVRGMCKGGAEIAVVLTAHTQDEAVTLFSKTITEVLKTIAEVDYSEQPQEVTPHANPVLN